MIEDAQAAAALARLFRRSLAQGTVNPLLPLLRQYRGVSSPLVVPEWTHTGSREKAPQVPVSLGELQRAVIALPSLPQAVQDALAALRDERTSAAAIAERIEHDQAMVARTLRAANTAFYGAPGRVATIRAAIAILGLRAVSALLTAAAVSARFPAETKSPLNFRRFWRHAMTTAIVARELAPAVRLDADVAFTAALLHDVGVLALATSFPAAYGVVQQYADHADVPLWRAERLVMGLDHGVAGELLAQRWRLPAVITSSIAAHHAPPAPSGPGAATLTELVHIADALAHGIGPEEDTHEVVPEVTVEIWSHLNISAENCLDALRSSSAAADALCEALAS
ncbi:HDOD domain-containing protein [uncultured Azohydromonas sp.]|uniref:HDOD domain-containing protein n=1 Tax=uncultured Azohydromonas sp. TaxID=487342 RepID=UPI00260F9294|nr:HDOD domain-containing protein [uncultured Azohydromonas sp.]